MKYTERLIGMSDGYEVDRIIPIEKWLSKRGLSADIEYVGEQDRVADKEEVMYIDKASGAFMIIHSRNGKCMKTVYAPVLSEISEQKEDVIINMSDEAKPTIEDLKEYLKKIDRYIEKMDYLFNKERLEEDENKNIKNLLTQFVSKKTILDILTKKTSGSEKEEYSAESDKTLMKIKSFYSKIKNSGLSINSSDIKNSLIKFKVIDTEPTKTRLEEAEEMSSRIITLSEKGYQIPSNVLTAAKNIKNSIEKQNKVDIYSENIEEFDNIIKDIRNIIKNQKTIKNQEVRIKYYINAIRKRGVEGFEKYIKEAESFLKEYKNADKFNNNQNLFVKAEYIEKRISTIYNKLIQETQKDIFGRMSDEEIKEDFAKRDDRQKYNMINSMKSLLPYQSEWLEGIIGKNFPSEYKKLLYDNLRKLSYDQFIEKRDNILEIHKDLEGEQ